MKKLFTLLFVLAICFTSNAQEKEFITPDDMFAMYTIYGNQMTVDGSKILYIKYHYEKETDTKYRDLYWLDTNKGKQHRLSYDNSLISSPQWSVDNKWIYFISKRGDKDDSAPYNGTKQIFRINLDGTLVQPITHSAKSIVNFNVGQSGKFLYYTVSKSVTEDDTWAEMRSKHSSGEYGHGEYSASVVYRFNLESGLAEKLVDNNDDIHNYAVSPDENWIAMITTMDNEAIHMEGWSDVKLFNFKTKKITTVPSEKFRKDAPSPYGWIEDLAWTADSKRLTFGIGYDGYLYEIFVMDIQKNGTMDIFPIQFPDHVTVSGSSFEWRGNTSELCVVGDEKARRLLYLAKNIQKGKEVKLETLTPGDKVINSYSISKDGKTISYTRTGLDFGRDLFIIDINKKDKEKRLTQINPQMNNWPMPNIEIIQWKAPDGTTIEGILETPKGYRKSDGPLPLVVSLHGGPTGSDKYAFRGATVGSGGRTIFSSRGWAVLAVNYRGSTGYGSKFLLGLIGNEGDIEVKDILSGVDYLVEQKIADENRMGIMGWSNGGILTSTIISKTERFKAASVGAGVFDKTMQWIIEDTPGHVINYAQGQPWEKHDELWEKSPISRVHKIKTPALIHQGENDLRVPPGHSKGLYRALKQYLNIPVELLTYPVAAHGPHEIKHIRAKIDWDIKWFDHYVLSKE